VDTAALLSSISSTTTDVQRIFNLEFASQREWNKAAVEKMVRKYQTWSGDTGSMPVLISVISVRIQYLTEHMRNNRKVHVHVLYLLYFEKLMMKGTVGHWVYACHLIHFLHRIKAVSAHYSSLFISVENTSAT